MYRVSNIADARWVLPNFCGRFWRAVRGGADLFEETGQDGRNQSLILGSNVWVPDPQDEKEHSYLLKTADEAYIAALLDGLMAQGPLNAKSQEKVHGGE